VVVLAGRRRVQDSWRYTGLQVVKQQETFPTRPGSEIDAWLPFLSQSATSDNRKSKNGEEKHYLASLSDVT
jgi:hypothetical protein